MPPPRVFRSLRLPDTGTATNQRHRQPKRQRLIEEEASVQPSIESIDYDWPDDHGSTIVSYLCGMTLGSKFRRVGLTLP